MGDAQHDADQDLPEEAEAAIEEQEQEPAPSPVGTKQLSFNAGLTLWEEGDDADDAFLILSGEVDLYRTQDDVFHHLGTVPESNIVGESSIIRREKRSTTARARTDVTALLIDGQALRRSISDPLINMIFKTMANRLADRYVPERALLQESQAVSAQRANRKKRRKHTGVPVLEGVSQSVLDKMIGKVTIQNFPFHIGNTRTPGEIAQLSELSLMLPLPSAPDLDAKHFEIIKRGNDVVVRDMGTKNGTVINGETVRKFSNKVEATLEPGENIISTGGMKSKVTFVVHLQEVE